MISIGTDDGMNVLAKMRLGQPVELTADLYGSDVHYAGTLANIGLGTGSAFALPPAQNASGNWIKVVQRIPVRIALQPKQLIEHRCRATYGVGAMSYSCRSSPACERPWPPLNMR